MVGFTGGHGYNDPEEELEETREHSQQVQQEIREDANAPTAVRVFYIFVGIALFLFLIVMIVGANVFHW